MELKCAGVKTRRRSGPLWRAGQARYRGAAKGRPANLRRVVTGLPALSTRRR